MSLPPRATVAPMMAANFASSFGPCRRSPHVDAWRNRNRTVVAHRLQQRQGPGGIERRVEGQSRRVFAVPMPIGGASILFLDMRGVRQHERAEVPCSRRAENPAAIALRHEAWQIAAVIEMCVRQDDG